MASSLSKAFEEALERQRKVILERGFGSTHRQVVMDLCQIKQHEGSTGTLWSVLNMEYHNHKGIVITTRDDGLGSPK